MANEAVPAPVTAPPASRGTLKLIVTLPRPFASGPVTAGTSFAALSCEVNTIGPVFDGPAGLSLSSPHPATRARAMNRTAARRIANLPGFQSIQLHRLAKRPNGPTKSYSKRLVASSHRRERSERWQFRGGGAPRNKPINADPALLITHSPSPEPPLPAGARSAKAGARAVKMFTA